MALHPRLEGLLNKGKSSKSNDELCKTLTLFAKEFGYTPKEMMEIPIPTFLIMLEEWNKSVKEQEKQMKSKGRMNRRR